MSLGERRLAGAVAGVAPVSPVRVQPVAIEHRRGWLVRRMLLLADVVGLAAAFVLAHLLLGSGFGPGDRLGATGEVVAFAISLPGWIIVAKLYGLYDRDEERTDHSTVDDVGGVFHLVTTGAWVFFLAASVTNVADPELLKVATFWVLAIPLVVCLRLTARAFCRRHPSYMQRTLIVGAGEVGQRIARKLDSHQEYGIDFLGFVDGAPPEGACEAEPAHVVGPFDDLRALVRRHSVERVIFAFSREPSERIVDAIRPLQEENVQIDVVPRLYELLSPNVSVHTVEGLPLIGLPPSRLPRSSRLLKRATDIVLAAVGLVIVAPLFIVIAAAIKLESRGPVFFCQTRMGSRRSFGLYKFRTMAPDADKRKHEFAHLNEHARVGGDPRMFKIRDDPRVTQVGRVLRRYSLDELPQLVNVLKGEMSLVGPRPLILEEDLHVESWARRRLDLRPGITGLWQVHGRSAIPFSEMVALDYVYVTTWSLANDFRLILRTIPALFMGRAH